MTPDTETAGDDFRVVDFGAHLHPKPVFPESLRPFEDLVGEVLWDPGALLEFYEETAVDAAVLSMPTYMGSSEIDRVARANDELFTVIDDHPAFFGLASIPVAAGGSTAAAEFERCLEAGFHGGAVETRTEGVELDDDSLEPVFDVAERVDVPILVHPKLYGSLHPDVLTEYALNDVFGREIALCESIFKVIHGGVLDRHPDLKLVYHHTGGNIAGMMGRIRLRLDQGRWPGDAGTLSFSEFKTRLENVAVDTSGFLGDSAPVDAALGQFPTSGILFGSDMPFEPRTPAEVDAMVSTVRDATTGGETEAALAGNARRLLAHGSER